MFVQVALILLCSFDTRFTNVHTFKYSIGQNMIIYKAYDGLMNVFGTN